MLSLTFCLRSPNADPNAKGMVSGLNLDTSERQLALQYLATVQGLAYGTRHIIEHCNEHGHKVRMILVSLRVFLYLNFRLNDTRGINLNPLLINGPFPALFYL